MKREAITQAQLDALARMLGMGAMLIDVDGINLALGRQAKGRDAWSMWTHAGHRIDVTLTADGGFMASQTKEPDPDCPSEACGG